MNWVNITGAALVVIGLAWGGLALLQLEKKLRHDRAELERISTTTEYNSDEQKRQLLASGIEQTNFGDIDYFKQNVQIAAIQLIKPSFSGPYILTAMGSIVSLVGNIIS